jgi:crotonobetainyl-CoA:carnitine CoA-transferase CaiB-like acyl-CoA transferase
MAENGSGPRPLEGVRVIEMGSLLAGPFCGQLLADFGAEVIKLEPPGKGDPMRQWGRHRKEGHTLWWPIIARNKKSVTLNLREEEGQGLARRLISGSDVVVENFRPGTLERWGLGYGDLSEVNPGLVMVRVSGYGQTGPYKEQAGFGSIGEAMGGIRHVTGFPDRPPPRVGISLGDSLASLYAVIGALMAVHARDVLGRGEGQVVDVALYEAVFNLMESLVPEYDVAGIVRERTGSSLPGITPSNTYCSGDGSYVAIGGNSDAIFKRLMKAIGRPELGEDPRYRTNADRTEHAEELDFLIEDWTEQHPIEEIMRILDEAAVPVGPIYSVEDIVEDEQYQARDMLLEAEIEGIGPVKMPGLTPKLSATPGEIEWYGGPLGAHNEEVYGGLLDLPAEEIERLSREGVI